MLSIKTTWIAGRANSSEMSLWSSNLMKYRQRGRREEPIGPLDPYDKPLCNETQQQFVVSFRCFPQCCDCGIIFQTGIDGNAI
jgi:hypothetical protein